MLARSLPNSSCSHKQQCPCPRNGASGLELSRDHAIKFDWFVQGQPFLFQEGGLLFGSKGSNLSACVASTRLSRESFCLAKTASEAASLSSSRCSGACTSRLSPRRGVHRPTCSGLVMRQKIRRPRLVCFPELASRQTARPDHRRGIERTASQRSCDRFQLLRSQRGLPPHDGSLRIIEVARLPQAPRDPSSEVCFLSSWPESPVDMATDGRRVVTAPNIVRCGVSGRLKGYILVSMLASNAITGHPRAESRS